MSSLAVTWSRDLPPTLQYACNLISYELISEHSIHCLYYTQESLCLAVTDTRKWMGNKWPRVLLSSCFPHVVLRILRVTVEVKILALLVWHGDWAIFLTSSQKKLGMLEHLLWVKEIPGQFFWVPFFPPVLVPALCSLWYFSENPLLQDLCDSEIQLCSISAFFSLQVYWSLRYACGILGVLHNN